MMTVAIHTAVNIAFLLQKLHNNIMINIAYIVQFVSTLRDSNYNIYRAQSDR